MRKADLISAILEIYDEKDDLERRLERALLQQPSEDDDNSFDAYFIKIGMGKVYEDSTRSWNKVRAWTNDDTGEIESTEFEKWLDEYIQDVPDIMSKATFVRIFGERLDRDFKNQTEDAVAKEKMRQESED